MALFGRKVKGGETASEAPGRERTQAPASPAPGGPASAVPGSPPQETQDIKRGEGSVFGRKSKSGEQPTSKGEAVANIGKSIIFKGELTGDEDLEIDGNVEGNIKLPSHVLTIGAHGKVKAEITAKCVQIVGHVAGNVNATERVEIQASGVVEGDISAPRLLVQEGAVLNGAIQMTAKKQDTAAKPAQQPKPGSGTPADQPARKAG